MAHLMMHRLDCDFCRLAVTFTHSTAWPGTKDMPDGWDYFKVVDMEGSRISTFVVCPACQERVNVKSLRRLTLDKGAGLVARKLSISGVTCDVCNRSELLDGFKKGFWYERLPEKWERRSRPLGTVEVCPDCAAVPDIDQDIDELLEWCRQEDGI